MKCKILHETTGRLRVHLCCGRMSFIPSGCAGVLSARPVDGVQAVKVYDRTQDAVVLYEAERGSIIRALAQFSFAKAEAMELVPEHTSRALNREFEDKLAVAVMRRCISKLFLPAPITTALALLRSVKYIREGLSALWHGKLSVAVLDATAVTVSMARGRFCHRRFGHVHAASGRNSGGVDPQKVRGRSCLRHEPAGGQRLAAGKRHRGADENHRCEAGGIAS